MKRILNALGWWEWHYWPAVDGQSGEETFALFPGRVVHGTNLTIWIRVKP